MNRLMVFACVVFGGLLYGFTGELIKSAVAAGVFAAFYGIAYQQGASE